MRMLIKTADYSFVNGSRQITVSNNKSFTAADIRLIINETQKVVITSSIQKDNILSVAGNVITYTNSLPALVTGDELTIEIDFTNDFGQKTYSIQIANGSFYLIAEETGRMEDIYLPAGVTLTSISKNGTEQSIPFAVNYGDIISGQIAAGSYPQTIELYNRITDTSRNIVMGSGVNCSRPFETPAFGAYWPAENKFIHISENGLAVYDDDFNLMLGTGVNAIPYVTGNAYSVYNYPVIEGNYLYLHSAANLLRIDLFNKVLVSISSGRSNVYAQIAVTANDIFAIDYQTSNSIIRYDKATMTKIGELTNAYRTYAIVYPPGADFVYIGAADTTIRKISLADYSISASLAAYLAYNACANADHIYWGISATIRRQRVSDDTFDASFVCGGIVQDIKIIGSNVYVICADRNVYKFDLSLNLISQIPLINVYSTTRRSMAYNPLKNCLVVYSAANATNGHFIEEVYI